MAFSFSKDPDEPGGQPDAPTAEAQPPAEPVAGPVATATSVAVLRFRSCRWYQAPEAGSAEFCTHREVKPYAGTTAFDAEAWCPDCVHFKLRRTPKKRDYSNNSYDY
ncbi:MAG: hypothetical protein Q7J25_05930 [Vicinamibacterales bacterium]|nr:hypothetical protein [Vicinamibacterales bacterium]